MMHHSLINSTVFIIQIYWTNNFTERTILLNKRFNWMIVQFENEQNRWKMNYNSENHLIIFLSEQLKKTKTWTNEYFLNFLRKEEEMFAFLALHFERADKPVVYVIFFMNLDSEFGLLSFSFKLYKHNLACK